MGCGEIFNVLLGAVVVVLPPPPSSPPSNESTLFTRPSGPERIEPFTGCAALPVPCCFQPVQGPSGVLVALRASSPIATSMPASAASRASCQPAVW